MPAGKPKVAIVAGDVSVPAFFDMFLGCMGEFDFTLFAFNRRGMAGLSAYPFPIRLFEPVADMAGYMRGLEAEMAGFDLILGVEPSRLSTFQGLRAALREGVPFGCISSESRPFAWSSFPNIRAIHHDVLQNSDRFLAMSDVTVHTLGVEGVARDRVSIIKPQIDVRQYDVQTTLRDKFRSYVGIAPNDFVVLVTSPLEEEWSALDIPQIAANLVALGRAQNVPVKLLVAANGSLAREIKYRSVDLKIGRSIMFLHQETEAFRRDLFNAVDGWYLPRSRQPQGQEEFPIAALQAMACGVTPIASAGTVVSELSGDAGLAPINESPEAVAAAAARMFHQVERRGLCRNRVSTINADSVQLVQAALGSLILENSRAGNSSVTAEFDRLVKTCEVDIRDGKESDALVRLEDLLLRRGTDARHAKARAEVLRVKGDALYSLRRYDSAMEAYAECVQIDDGNGRGYRGLGFVAWQSHSHDEAMAFFRKSLAIDERDARTMLGIGLVYRRIGVFEDALYWLERCVVDESVQAMAVSALTQTCSEHPRSEKSRDVLERVIESIGEKPQLMLSLGKIFLSQGDLERGNAILQRVIGDQAS